MACSREKQTHENYNCFNRRELLIASNTKSRAVIPPIPEDVIENLWLSITTLQPISSRLKKSQKLAPQWLLPSLKSSISQRNIEFRIKFQLDSYDSCIGQFSRSGCEFRSLTQFSCLCQKTTLFSWTGMLTKRNRFYTAIRGRIIHATSIEGLQGIIRDGMILPNCDGSKGYAYWGKQIASYCQRKGGISVMDLLSIDETKLFDAKGPAHHWTGVFCFHHPTILLLLSNKHVAPYLFHPAPQRKPPASACSSKRWKPAAAAQFQSNGSWGEWWSEKDTGSS